jgi:sugar phosphate isomerase/epimerase
MTKSLRTVRATALAGVAAMVMSVAMTAAPAMAQESHLGIPMDKVGVVSFTLRAQLGEDPRATLKAVAACGIENIEFSSPRLGDAVPAFAGVPVPEIKAYMQEFGFNVPSLGVNGGDLTDRLDVVISSAKELGATFVRISGVDAVKGETQVEYFNRLADTMNTAGAALAAEGITLAYHNHDREFRYLGDGDSGYDILLKNVDPANAGFEVDLYWAFVGGANPVKLIEENNGRVVLYHVKDAHDVDGKTTMTTVGLGNVPFADIFEHDEAAGVQYYFIENDRPLPDGVTSTCDGYAYMAAANTEEADALIAASASAAANAAEAAEIAATKAAAKAAADAAAAAPAK